MFILKRVMLLVDTPSLIGNPPPARQFMMFKVDDLADYLVATEKISQRSHGILNSTTLPGIARCSHREHEVICEQLDQFIKIVVRNQFNKPGPRLFRQCYLMTHW